MKKYLVRMTDPAETDIRRNFQWWSDNHSPTQARTWMLGIRAAILALETMPERYGYADEKALRQEGIRQMGFGVGNRSTHRVIYAVMQDEVIIYRVRAGRQDQISTDDLQS